MIVYVESNFVLELAFLQEEHQECEEILGLAVANKITLMLPAFSVGEPYGAWVGRDKQRRELRNKLTNAIRELTRSKPYQELAQELQSLTDLLVQSSEEEKSRLDTSLDRILSTVTIIPIDANIIRAAINFQHSLDLKPQDSIVYASIISELKVGENKNACFITKNSRDFVNPSIKSELNLYNCRLLTTFRDGLGFIRSKL